MERFKGTKGKWSVSIYGEIISDIEDTGIVAGDIGDGTHYGCENSDETIKANAQVMASSKELLGGLIYAVEALRAISSFGATEPIIKELEDIIKRATEI